MRCPICKKPVPDAPPKEAPSPYPFCCERCKLIDLGRWLSGKYSVPIKDEETSPAVESNPWRDHPD